jgi:transposase
MQTTSRPDSQHSAKTEGSASSMLAPRSPAELNELVHAQARTIDELTQQLEWFKRQVFGAKSERFAPAPDPTQMHLGEVFPIPSGQPESRQSVPAHTRRVAKTDLARADTTVEALPFFDESRVPIETITVIDAQTKNLRPDQFEVIGERLSYRLAQRPGSYVVLKYVRPLIKRLDTQTIHCPPAPVGVLEGSRADVSFAAGLLIDKFAYHLPLYRQHQRLTDAGITVSRPWLTQLAQRTIGLLAPIYAAQLASVRSSRVIAMDETPIKAARAGPGKMKTGYFWPIYGQADEVCFPFAGSRAHEHVPALLGLPKTSGAVLVSDGYAAYERYVEKTGLKHAQCWAHSRRHFFEAQNAEPNGAAEALTQIQAIYRFEEEIRELKLAGDAKQGYRLTHSKPRVEAFFQWVDRQFERQGFTPSNPFIKALAYVRERRLGLEVFLTDLDVPIDTNHLERALRVIPMGRKSWLFCWTELGAQQVGIVQSLIVTCRLHGIDPYTYLVDVLQRVSEQPATRVAELTPRLWKQHFAHAPMRSDLYGLPA